jgi:hypothetical protein
MIDSDDLYGLMEVGNDLSTALGTEILANRDMVSPSFDYTPGSSADTLPIKIFEYRRLLRVERRIKKLIIPERNAVRLMEMSDSLSERNSSFLYL